VSVQEPAPPRGRIEETSAGLLAVIPAPRNWAVALFMSLWLAGWAVGWVSAAAAIFGGFSSGAPLAHARRADGFGRVFLSVWLTAWTAGGAWAIYQLLWSLTGREELLLGAQTLTATRVVAGWKVIDEYRLEDVKRLRAVAYVPVRRGSTYGHRSVAFDYGAKTVRLCAGLDEAEARSLVNALIARRPSLGD
jgi:hypothetical protein